VCVCVCVCVCDVCVVCVYVCVHVYVYVVCMCARVEKGQDECPAVLPSIYVLSFIRTPMVATG